MYNIKATLTRGEENDFQTLGKIKFECDSCDETLELHTLELPDNSNKNNISRINAGVYKVEKRVSNKYGKHFILRNVPGRSYILFHSGNYNTDTKGCILIGEDLKDLNGDGLKDLKYSKRAMDKMMKFTEWRNFTLEIL